MLPRLRQLREKNGYTLEDVAQALGLRNQYVSNYELGKRNPDFETLVKFARFYHVSTDYLLGNTDDPTPPRETSAVPEEFLVMARKTGALTEEQRQSLFELLDKTIDNVMAVLEKEKK